MKHPRDEIDWGAGALGDLAPLLRGEPTLYEDRTPIKLAELLARSADSAPEDRVKR